jgi:beta-glucosidase
VMQAYNKVNGPWCAENPHLLTDVLKKKRGFKGYVVSHLRSTRSTAASPKEGLDLEMPRGPSDQERAVPLWRASRRSDRIGSELYKCSIHEEAFCNPRRGLQLL